MHVSASTRFNLLAFVVGGLAAVLGFWTLSKEVIGPVPEGYV